jgi:hypothetical protein
MAPYPVVTGGTSRNGILRTLTGRRDGSQPREAISQQQLPVTDLPYAMEGLNAAMARDAVRGGHCAVQGGDSVTVGSV